MTRARPRLPYLRHETTRHGARSWYFRMGDGPRIRVKGDYGSAEFLANYRAAIAGGQTPQSSPRAPNGSLAWLIARYQDSPAWARLSEATRSQRANIFRRVCKTAGEMLYATITQKHIKAGVSDRAATPFAANDFLKAIRALFGGAIKSDFIT